MSSIRPLFEKELKNKLSLKSSGHTSEETVLLKAFKYFDLDNSGLCSKEEFVKAITKIGITGFTEQNLREIFEFYDEDKSGELSYKEFVGGLYGNTSITRGSDVKKNPNEGNTKRNFLNRDEVKKILDKIRSKLASRGVRGIISIGKNFKIIDDDNSRCLSLNEFRKACKDFRFELNDSEVDLAFKAFDRENSGEISYDEFLRTLRGEMNSFRQKLVEQAFSRIDKDGNGWLDINDVKGVYNARNHPDVKQGKKTEEEVLLEFLETFEAHHNIIESEAPDHIITKEEFLEYYENTSMSIDDDAYFELMMNNCWRMNNNTTYNNEKKGWSNKEEESGNVQGNYQNRKVVKDSRSKTPVRGGKSNDKVQVESKSSNPVVDKFKDKLAARGGRGIIGLARQFKIFDDNNSKTLEYDEFAKACKDFKIDLSPNEMRIVFQIFDRDSSGVIDYDEFLRSLRGELNDRRKKIILQVYDKLDTDKSGIVDINDIKYVYNVKNHPDVKSGKKTEEDVYGEFLETFETHHNINKGTKDKRVTKEEFLEYYSNISMSIDNDDYFELMMTNAWKLNGNNKYDKGVSMEYDFKAAGKSGQNRVQSGRPVSQNAPWGTTQEPTNYSTSLRPNNQSQNNNNKGSDPLSKFRAKLAARGTRGIMGIRRSFQICDDDNSREINSNEFQKLIKDYRIDISDDEVKKLFRIFDRNNGGSIDYDEFVKGVVGDMNDFRKAFVKKAFNKLDKNGNNALEVDDIKGVYNARNHPDVKAGKKTEDEVLAEFLDTFEYHFNILNENKTKNRSISMEEFIEYYNNISMSIDDDKYFELMMNSTWNLDNSRVTQKGWKGEY